MQIVIDISDEMYQTIKDGTWCGNELWYNALKNGTPLEKVIEDIKSDISNIYCGQYCYNPMTATEVREIALDIIDSHISRK